MVLGTRLYFARDGPEKGRGVGGGSCLHQGEAGFGSVLVSGFSDSDCWIWCQYFSGRRVYHGGWSVKHLLSDGHVHVLATENGFTHSVHLTRQQAT